MEIQGKIIAVLPERGGVSQRTGSEWKVATYVIETMEQYPRKCAFEVFGSDKIQLFNIQVGQLLKVSFDIDAHDYQGRWYNQIRAWRVEPYDPNAPVAAAAPDAGFAAAAQPCPARRSLPTDHGPACSTCCCTRSSSCRSCRSSDTWFPRRKHGRPALLKDKSFENKQFWNRS